MNKYAKKKTDSEIKSPYRAVQRDGRVIGEHRWVVEQKIGRRLLSKEHVHHLDDNGLNNDPDNLEIKTPNAHARMHGARHRKSLPKWVIDTIRSHQMKIKDIAKILGVNRSTLQRKLRRQMPNRVRHHPWEKGNWGEILDAFFGGVPPADVCKQFGVSWGTLYGRACRDPRYDRKPRSTSERDAKVIASMYQGGFKLKTIAAEVNMNRVTVCRLVRRMGLKKRRAPART